MSAIAPQDATIYWLSERTRNDIFLLYCFTDRGQPTEELRAVVVERSARIPDLRVHLRELPADIDYPSWAYCGFAAEQFMEHQLVKPDWSHLLEALGELLGTGVDAAVRPWRLHVFRGIVDAPGPGDGSALVAVLQLSHALADGRRASAIGRALFSESDVAGVALASPARQSPARQRWPLSSLIARGREVGTLVLTHSARTDPVVRARRQGISAAAVAGSALGALRLPVRLVTTVLRGYQAMRAQRQLTQLTATGQVPPPGPGFPPCLVNRPVAEPQAKRGVRMLVFGSAEVRVPGRTVTVVVLTAVSVALARYLDDRGEPVPRLGAQVPMALPEQPTGRGVHPRNSYRSLGVDLFIDEPDLRLRADKIAAALADRRLRAQHPLLSVQGRVTATVPAPLLRRDVARYPLDTVPDSVAGHTVVSSVDRGRADLTFGGGAVRFTAGFPALGSVMHLTHGVHGLGDTVTVSLHADPAVLPDLDAYAHHLRHALAAVHDAHRPEPDPVSRGTPPR
ncbi:WS/DGAT domain-containing protein [Nocardia sp. 004]|uniref:WS/DGAT domain-containing protein n=1 Tax=Nocardia sp. 004 TaxID=3385978 RepID=UPI0039A09776